ncbi:hypothetical protein SAMD00020551_1616 [Mesobacillus selenatarsenatis SF-1]|uniref:Uncharacterized protein n=1 Tax=Mesobacillus selenatarsenatis (strain DSM 18680 / JCM 14380 / FERM P-15431 / SF-1) TaxID=1321606 RepID=A0A0A8X375_MESS1|nr:hypothetical protein SAMD00020551_1616 [Mesobacillus selenatarsenatis SF-1]
MLKPKAGIRVMSWHGNLLRGLQTFYQQSLAEAGRYKKKS